MLSFGFGLAQTEFFQHEITTTFMNGMDVIAVDIDSDNDVDIVGVNYDANSEVALWENNGFNEFEKVTLFSAAGKLRSVRAEDMNSDGKTDLVIAAIEEDDVLLLKNNGNLSFEPLIIDDDFIGAHTIDIKDVNNDNLPDVLCSGWDFSGANSEIAWWENDGQMNNYWVMHTISDRFQQSPFIFGADMDNDSDMDIVACGEVNDEILWWENDGNQDFSEHMVDSLMNAIHTVIARDVDKDGDMDILGSACMSSQIAWYENDGDQNFIKHSLGYFAGALWLDAIDLDNDNDRDLFGAPQGGNQLSWWENPGNEQFIKHNFNSSFTQSFSVVPAMMDNDNDTDLVAIGYLSNKISWFENKLTNPNPYNHPECCVYDYGNERWLISSTGGNEPGYISEVDEEGNVQYFKTNIPDPLGMCIAENILYVSDADNAVLGFDLDTKEEVFNFPYNAIGNLDGQAYDNNGHLYVVDTYGRIIKIDLGNSSYNVFVHSGLSSWTQDIVFDEANNRLLAIGWIANAPIQAISLEDTSITNYPTSFGYYDGITMDQFGNVYLASHQSPGRIIRYFSDLSGEYEVISTQHNEPAGLHYNIVSHVLAVPNYGGSTVDFISVIPTINQDMLNTGSNLIEAFPNPFSDLVHFRINTDYTDISILNSVGGLVRSLKAEKKNQSGLTLTWDGKDNLGKVMSPGLYYIVVRSNEIISSARIIKN